ncbi:MAG TPA: SUMF1/EgtB/PvdO family nonheme iron enzyme [Verrucomicrobiae bacterium]
MNASIGRWVLMLLVMAEAVGHPGSGIVVDGEGRIYFTDTGQGIWRVEKDGRVKLQKGPPYHWMTIDQEGRHAAGRWPEFVERSPEIERVGRNPTLLVGSDFPITTGRDGALYYPEFGEGGPLRIYTIAGEGERSERKVFATVRTGADGAELKWLNGIAAGPDGAIYFTENAAVRRISREGEVTTLAKDVVVENCQRIEGAGEHLGPMLRGLDVGRDGTVYAAASGCRALLKIAKDGAVTTVLRNEAPWSPTGVAVSGEVVYVLEYLHTDGGDRRDWLPRVRKISADGSSTIIAQIERVGEKESRAVQNRAEAGRSFEGAKAGEEVEIGGVKFCWCPAGKFKMGSPTTETFHRTDEEQVEVTISKGFWMGKFEVTQGEWKRVMGTEHGEVDDARRKLNAGVGERFPIYWVSYEDAEEFCRKVTQKARETGELPRRWEVRLPTEAQWEYACRAGTKTAYSFGEAMSKEDANFGKPYDGTPTGVPGSAASAVGSYPANGWGLHDMHGNVFEWCRDWYHARLVGGTDPLRGDIGTANRDGSSSRVRRGGAWTDKPEFCRSAVRIRFEPHRSSDHIGFRVAIVNE